MVPACVDLAREKEVIDRHEIVVVQGLGAQDPALSVARDEEHSDQIPHSDLQKFESCEAEQKLASEYSEGRIALG